MSPSGTEPSVLVDAVAPVVFVGATPAVVAAQAAVAVAGLAVLAVLVLLARLLWLQRASARRLDALADRLALPGGDQGGQGIDRSVERIERGLDAVLVTRSDDRLGRVRATEALSHVEQGVAVCDDRGDIVYRNDRAAEFEGARHGEALAKQVVDELLDAALAGEARNQSLDLFGPPRRTLLISAFPLDDGPRTIGAVALIDDVSERRRLEAVRRDFVANISHELKTPVGALGLLAETIDAEDDPDLVRRLSRRMHDEAFRVSRIIDDLLDLSRIEAEATPRREPVLVHVVVAEAVERVRSLCEHRGMTVDVRETPKRLTVMGDRRQLVSAVHNLLENALKYSERGATVEVRVRTVAGGDGLSSGDGPVAPGDPGWSDWVEIAVKDSGIGIPRRDIERIFERFYRVDRARGRDTGGTGLGLAIVRHVVGNHGGEVRVDSREGVGSTFTLRLPSGRGGVVLSEAG